MSVDAALDHLGRVERMGPYAYRTSWPLDEVEVVRADGSKLRLIVKHFDGAEVVKPPFVVDPAREIEVYGLLDGAALGTPACHASGRGWMAIEKVEGEELWQRGDLGAWEATLRWAARLHAVFAARRPAVEHLLHHDAEYYRRWAERAREAVGDAVGELGGQVETAIVRLTALAPTLIHGELYASNVIVADDRIAVVDWEMAAIGPAVIDVAAVVTGWGEADQERLVRAYGDVDRRDLAAARMLLALQWLGWVEGWQAPAEHRRDWLGEAREAAEVLG